MKPKYKRSDSYNNGYTLVEVVVVIVILGILTAIAVPSMMKLIDKTNGDVCESNRLQLQRMYETNLTLKGIDHSGVEFDQYLLEYGAEICPDGGVISYVEDEVHCSIHSVEEDGDENGGGVPFL